MAEFLGLGGDQLMEGGRSSHSAPSSHFIRKLLSGLVTNGDEYENFISSHRIDGIDFGSPYYCSMWDIGEMRLRLTFCDIRTKNAAYGQP